MHQLEIIEVHDSVRSGACSSVYCTFSHAEATTRSAGEHPQHMGGEAKDHSRDTNYYTWSLTFFFLLALELVGRGNCRCNLNSAQSEIRGE